MQSLLGRNTPPEVDAGETRAGERLTGRRRNLGEFLRGIGGGASAHRFGALLDDDFSSFFGRDSAALDPRNYLVRLFYDLAPAIIVTDIINPHRMMTTSIRRMSLCCVFQNG